MNKIIFSVGSVGTIAMCNLLSRYEGVFLPHWNEANLFLRIHEQVYPSTIFIVHKHRELDLWSQYIQQTPTVKSLHMVRNPSALAMSLANMWLFRDIIAGMPLPADVTDWLISKSALSDFICFDRIEQICRETDDTLVIDTSELSDAEIDGTDLRIREHFQLNSSPGEIEKGVKNSLFDRFLHHSPVFIAWQGIQFKIYFSAWGKLTLSPQTHEIFNFKSDAIWPHVYDAPKTIRVLIDTKNFHNMFFEDTRKLILPRLAEYLHKSLPGIGQHLLQRYESALEQFEAIQLHELPTRASEYYGQILNSKINSFVERHPHLQSRWNLF
ncbi:MAG: hypothetical protein OEZ43_00355 [Gammaproteobacteria bacterium]|nr:hypothetical protein [Gammaproteobacteria bacterium]